MALKLESLEKAIGALGRSLRVTQEQAGGDDVDLKETLRAGVVQNFKVAGEFLPAAKDVLSRIASRND